jgi:hypothetical protein
VVVTNQNSNDIAILLGMGGGLFGAPMKYTAGKSPAAVMVSDFTADGKSDLAVMSQSSDNVSVFIGNGNGDLHAGRQLPRWSESLRTRCG